MKIHAFEAAASPSVLGAFRRAEMALRQTDILDRALKAGEPSWILRVFTDLAEEGEIEFHARAQVTP